ncbi:MAG: lipid-A-disaccharide synthase [Phycisphaerae bacterium]|nr:lipid-A-disaccharide synthase [Phycisphaerae bacterium]
MAMQKEYKIFISAAELSGDQHAAKLINAIMDDMPTAQCFGLGGPNMENAGCELMENLVDKSAMLTHILKLVPFYKKLLKRVKKTLIEEKPDLVILVDSPAWNFNVAKVAHKLEIPVLAYIAPQLWAWGGWRIKKTRRDIDRIACILPFEEKWFRDRNVAADYIGNPLFDEESNIASNIGFNHKSKNFPTIALLPGSRQHEIETLWLPMQEIASEIKKRYPQVNFVSAVPNAKVLNQLKSSADAKLNIDIQHRSIEATVRYADLALVASGTATMEIASQDCPMIVMYSVTKLQKMLGKLLLKIKYIALVNILADKMLVPEFVPFEGSEEEIVHKALGILSNDQRRSAMRQELHELMEPIIKPGAAANTIKIIKQMLPKY